MIIGILAFLLILEPLGALIILILLSEKILILNKLVRNKIIGQISDKKTGERLKILQQSLGIIDELNYYG